jgi:hypothetical protein
MEVTKPYEFTRFGAMEVNKPYEFIGFGTDSFVGIVTWVDLLGNLSDYSPTASGSAALT